MSAAETYTVIRFEVESGNFRTYHVHFIQSNYDHYINFEAYPVSDWTGPNNTSGTDYLSQHSSDNVDEFVHGGVLLHFYGSMCWRGVWESRIYFPNDNEYDGDDLAEFAELWKKHIEPWCKDYLKKKQPDLEFDE